jgi:hypothetical protein
MHGLFILLVSSLFAGHAFASAPPLNWVDLEPGTLVRLNTLLTIDPTLRFEKGAKFAINHSEPLPAIKVQILKLRHFPCSGPLAERRVPMVILDSGQGFEMDKGCEVTLYHEFNEFYRPSPFEQDEP